MHLVRMVILSKSVGAKSKERVFHEKSFSCVWLAEKSFTLKICVLLNRMKPFIMVKLRILVFNSLERFVSL